MSAAKEIIEALVAAGMEPSDAATLFARAVIETTVPNNPGPSPGALRQRRYKERLAVTKRHQSVTERHENEPSPGVTKPSPGVTERHSDETHISYLLTSSNIEDKKESKRERIPRKRHSPLPDDWHPPERAYALAREYGTTVPLVDQIFQDYLKSSGKLYADYDAAFCNFVRNQSKFGRPNHAAAAAKVVHLVGVPTDAEWRAYLDSYKRFGKWRSGLGNEPSSPACRAPQKLLREFGFIAGASHENDTATQEKATISPGTR